MFNFSPRLRDASPRLRDTDVLTRGCWIGKRREFCFEENVAGLGATEMKEITIKVYIPLIYNVNTSLQSKYYKTFINN